MIFYEISGKLKSTAGMFDKNGRVERDNLSAIQIAADNIAAVTMAVKMRIDVCELRADRFRFVAVTNFNALKKYSIADTTNKLLGELNLCGEIREIEEITEKNCIELLRSAARNDFCASVLEIERDFGLSFGFDNYERNFFYIERRLEPICYGTVKSKAPSLKNVVALSEKLACENLTAEIKRISSNKKYGTPVHYIIQMENMASCNEVYNFLLDCLKRNGRILRGVVNIWSNTGGDSEKPVFGNANQRDLRRLYDKSEYGAVVIKSHFEESGGDAMPSHYQTIKQICGVIKANKKNVLTILCVEKGAVRQQKTWLDNLENMAFVEIKEKVMFLPEATKYLALIAEKDGMQNAEGLFKGLEDGKGYTRADLESAYSDFYADYQKRVEFPEYKDVAFIEKKIEEHVEGIAYTQLQSMVGLHKVKEQIDNIVNFAKVQKLAVDKGLKTSPVTKHMVFTGSPGTAKTTVARLFAQIMKDNGLLTGGKFLETGRADLVGEYIGQTAPKVKDKFRQAKGGVLFIDEAYSLVDDRRGLYGDEAINTIVQEMENNRENTIVIFAGYKKEMKDFIERNSGLKSRVAHYVDFPDYDEYELADILELMVCEQGLKLSGGRENILSLMKTAAKQENFGNGRFARNLLDAARLRHAGRVAKMKNPEADDIMTLISDDFELPKDFSGNRIRALGFNGE